MPGPHRPKDAKSVEKPGRGIILVALEFFHISWKRKKRREIGAGPKENGISAQLSRRCARMDFDRRAE